MNRSDWQITPEKFLNAEELSKLMIRADELKTLGIARKRPQLIRDWMILNCFIFTGIRRREACELRCLDFNVFGGNSYLIVRRGKGGTDDKPKTRHVHLPKGFAKDVRWYLRWKAERGEIDEQAYFFKTERTPKYTPSGIYKRVKKYCPNHHPHTFRHTNATILYEATNCLRLVQKQLGHAAITTTQVYADVSVDQSVTGMTAMEKLVNGLKRKAVKATAYAVG
jgi:integrase/recombinase XerD